MKNKNLINLFALTFCFNLNATPEMLVQVPTKEEAFEITAYYIKSLPWFINNGYKDYITLPEHEEFKKIYQDVEKIPNYNFENLRNIFYTEIYNPKDYKKGSQVVQNAVNTIDTKLFEKLKILNKNWGFDIKPKYFIELTLYGTGGAYWEPASKIIIKTGKNGITSYYIPQSIIRHIIHIGIENNIVKKYNLTQKEKERVVALICSIYLKDILTYIKDPDHLVDYNIDPFINEKVITENLPKAIEDYITKYPR
ncbi:MAG: hypothetical protein SZ59_C0001G0153 [candidate division TM6 bacterium GW2011_GWF2_28_16]|nr:MAG: hypothetical protein SZ59_C0001G0153 [candidate division TM6 bacterium GW2011_GWF2_28_16]